MPVEIIGEFGTPGAEREWIVAEFQPDPQPEDIEAIPNLEPDATPAPEAAAPLPIPAPAGDQSEIPPEGTQT